LADAVFWLNLQVKRGFGGMGAKKIITVRLSPQRIVRLSVFLHCVFQSDAGLLGVSRFLMFVFGGNWRFFYVQST
jgi:hypothetical protein